MLLTEHVDRSEGFASVFALANGRRPRSHFHIDSMGVAHRSEIELVSSWDESMRKHFTSGSKLPEWKHTQILNSKRGAWMMEFVQEGKRANVTLIYIDTKSMKETSFEGIIVQGDHENYCVIIPEMNGAKGQMLSDLLAPGGALSRAFHAGMRRLFDPAWPGLYDWTHEDSKPLTNQ